MSRRINGPRWLSAAVSLVVAFVLSLSSLTPVTAAPPETVQEQEAPAQSSDVTSDDPGLETDSPRAADSSHLPETQVALVANVTPRHEANGGDGSVRLRGLEAPVQLARLEAQGADRPVAEGKTSDARQKAERDPGDGPVRKRPQAAKKRGQDQKRDRRDIRIWPMPAESYSFTQKFGCVPQLGNLYFPGEGCPANAPVIHTGIDMAAPEGTPFYAAASGWVTLADYDRPTSDANTRIIIQHDGRNEGYATDYLHWIASYVEEGDYVQAGDPIGEVGSVGFSTGPHLHFSVTDLDSGEHIDPLQWLPKEPGLEGYVSDIPRARLRLPAGTTAGQPESADPAPPAPPVKERVPKAPPEDGKRGQRSERKRDERRGQARDDTVTNDAKRSGKKRSRDNGAAEAKTDEATNKRDRSRERERTRERNKDGAPSEDTASGDDGGSSGKRDDSKADRRANREADKDAGSGDKGKRKGDGDERAGRDTEPDDTSGRDENDGRDKRGADRKDPGQGKADDGTGKGEHRHRRKS